jgi:methionine synthase II (cobalamin-independent)
VSDTARSDETALAPGTATGIGSLPGTDPEEAARLVVGELPDLPHLPELPARGPGADLIGRTAALLVDLPVEVVPSGWRLTAHAGRDVRRARDFLAFDLDALGAAADGYAGPVKVQCAGPWTLAAALELPNGNAVLTDYGAVRDLAESLREGIAAHLAELAIRLPPARALVQLDEPGLPAVLRGTVPTASGFGTIGAVEPTRAEEALAVVLAGLDRPAVHCCAADVPITLLRNAGAAAIALDLGLLDQATAGLDALGEAVDAGTTLWLGAVPTPTGPEPGYAAVRDRIVALWHRLGFATALLGTAVVPTPACGLAGASPQYARAALRAVRDAGRALRDLADA